MTEVRLSSESIPNWGAPLIASVAALITKTAAMGVLSGPRVTKLDAATIGRLVRALHRHGIGADVGVVLAPLAGERLDAKTSEAVQRGLARLNEALEASAAPSVEWPAMRAVFGDEALVQLTGVAPSSMRRYATGERATPDEVAARLHWLALVVGDLAGSYNDFGIRRWFERPRVQLDAKSPRAVLGSQWTPGDAATLRVRALAAVLSGPHPLAA